MFVSYRCSIDNSCVDFVTFVLHCAWGAAYAFAIEYQIGCVTWIAFIPWLVAAQLRCSWTCFVAGTLVSATCVGMAASDFVPSDSSFIRSWVWIPGSFLIIGVNWTICSAVARVLLARRLPSLLVALLAWFLFEANLIYTGRMITEGGLPLLQLGTLQNQYPLLRVASIAGVTGVGCMVVIINWMFYQLACTLHSNHRVKLKHIVVGAVALLGLVCSTYVRSPTVSSSAVVAVTGQRIRAHDPPNWTSAALGDAQLVVFGEGAFKHNRFVEMPNWSPTMADSQSESGKILHTLAREWRRPFIVGADRYWYADGRHPFTSVVLVTPESGVHQAYDKQYLVPDREITPRALRWSRKLVGQAADIPSTLPGCKNVLFNIGDDFSIGPTICFDLYFSEVFVSYVQSFDIDFFVNCGSHASLNERMDKLAIQHARLRAIETGRSVVHVAIDGTSCVVDADGTLIEKFVSPAEGSRPRIVNVPLKKRNTFFSRVGRDILDLAFAAFLLILVTFFLMRPAKHAFSTTVEPGQSRLPATGNRLVSEQISGQMVAPSNSRHDVGT